MTQPLNFTPKAIADLTSLAAYPTCAPHSRKGFLFLADLLRRAEVFVVPEAGELFDRAKPRPEVPGLVYKPAFPIIAIEYMAGDNRWMSPDEVRCPRRIALAWEWDGRMPSGHPSKDGPEPGSGVMIASISYFETERMWMPVGGAMMIAYNAAYEAVKTQSFQEAMLATGRISRRHLEVPGLQLSDTLALLPEGLNDLAQRAGLDAVLNTVARDLMDEINAYCDLCLALACNNVNPVRHSAPAALNKHRIKAGKLPLKDFHVLEIAGHGEGAGFDGAGTGGVRSHLRRGHIRRLGPERITWVNAAMVRGRQPGFVDKQYAPKGVRA